MRGRIVGVRCSGTVSGMEKQLDPPTETSPPPDMKSFKEDFKKSPGAMLAGLLFASIIVFVPLALFGGGAYFAWDYLDLKAHGALACYGFGILLLLWQVNFWNGLRRRAEEPS